MSANVFLARNGMKVTATEANATQIVTALAADELGEDEFAAWLRTNCKAT